MLLHRHQLEVLTGCLSNCVFLANFLGDGFGFGLRLNERDTRFEPPNSAPLHIVTVGYVVGNARSEPETRKLFQIRFWGEQQFKTWGEHANDDGRWSKRGSHWKSFPNYRSIPTKPLLEVFVAQNNHIW